MSALTLKLDLRRSRPRAVPTSAFGARLMLRIRLTLVGSLFAAIAFTVLGFYAVLHAESLAALRAAVAGWGATRPALEKLQGALLLVVPVLACFGLFWLMVKVQIKRLLRADTLMRHLQAAMVGEMQRAQMLAAGISDQVLADLRKRGANAAEIAEMEQRLNAVAHKVKLSSQQMLEQYQSSPARLVAEIRAKAGEKRR